MYKLPLKIAGIIISIILFVMAFDMQFFQYFQDVDSLDYNIIKEKTYKDHYGLVTEYYFVNSSNGDKISVDNNDRAMLEAQVEYGKYIVRSTQRTVNGIGTAFSHAFNIAGAILLVLSLCIKTPLEEKLIEKIKSKREKDGTKASCRVCGAEIGEKVKFCPCCGASASDTQTNPATI